MVSVEVGMNEKFDIEAYLRQECADELGKDIDSKVLWELLYADEFTYSVKLPKYGSYPERYVWLNANVGEFNWWQHDGKICFKQKEHLAWYILRWS